MIPNPSEADVNDKRIQHYKSNAWTPSTGAHAFNVAIYYAKGPDH